VLLALVLVLTTLPVPVAMPVRAELLVELELENLDEVPVLVVWPEVAVVVC